MVRFSPWVQVRRFLHIKTAFVMMVEFIMFVFFSSVLRLIFGLCHAPECCEVNFSSDFGETMIMVTFGF